MLILRCLDCTGPGFLPGPSIVVQCDVYRPNTRGHRDWQRAKPDELTISKENKLVFVALNLCSDNVRRRRCCTYFDYTDYRGADISYTDGRSQDGCRAGWEIWLCCVGLSSSGDAWIDSPHLM